MSGTTVSGVVTTTKAVRQLSDGNFLSGGPGTVLGQSAADGIAFYGAAQGVAQPTGNVLDPVARGGTGGMVMTFASSQTPSSVATLTTAEQSVTVQSGTGATLTPATGDFFIVNKPTSQAGLGVGNIRYSSAGIVGVTFDNFTTGTLTPTAGQTYGIVGIRGLDTLTTVLTPATVVSNTTAEQIFTVAGIRTGTVLGVNKPTSQPGLDIVNIRASGDNQVGITYVNVTGGALTPTAGEIYTIFATGGIEAITDQYILQANSTLTPAVVATVTTAEITLTSLNVAATDFMVGVQKPTFQAGLGVVGGRVSAVNTVKVDFVNPTGGTLTPTASEDYAITIARPAIAAPVVIYAVTITPASVAPNTTAEQAFTVTGVVASSAVLVNKPSATPGIGIVGARVSAANSVAINYCNATANTITPASETYLFANFTGLIDTTAGNAFIQTGDATDDATPRFLDGLQTALGPTGLNLINYG